MDVRDNFSQTHKFFCKFFLNERNYSGISVILYVFPILLCLPRIPYALIYNIGVFLKNIIMASLLFCSFIFF